jgi:hypothetical protein
MTTFNPDQQMALLEWLEFQKQAGLTLEEVIDGLTNGTLTAVKTIEPIQGFNFPSVS